MNIQSDQVLTKTPQGVNATRSGVGLSPKASAMLKLFDGSMPVSAFRNVCTDAAISDSDFQSTLAELVQLDHLRLGGDSSKPSDEAVPTAAERRMLLTLDFTVNDDAVGARSAKPAATAAAAATKGAPPLKVVPPPAARPMPPAAPTMPPADGEAEDRTARLRRENEIRQKLMVALQPRIEEELRARLRPKLEEELRPKLIAALRPGIEAEVRTALLKELTPRVELELKARFAKTLAAQKLADQQAPPAVTPVVSEAAQVSGASERLLASLSAPLFSVDRTGVCNYMSAAWAQFSGIETANVIGKPLVDFFADADRRAVSALLSGISTGTALRFELQGRVMREDSEPLWVQVSAAPLTSASGELIGVCGSMRDATELRQAAGQAEADGVRLLLLVDQIDTGVILEDAQGNIQQANPALCTLLSLEAAPYSLEGMPVSELLETAARSFIGPEGYLRRVAEIREAGEDAKDESFVMADGRVVAQDYLAVTVGDDTVGHLWIFREMARSTARQSI